jgi:hypothetical protein
MHTITDRIIAIARATGSTAKTDAGLLRAGKAAYLDWHAKTASWKKRVAIGRVLMPVATPTDPPGVRHGVTLTDDVRSDRRAGADPVYRRARQARRNAQARKLATLGLLSTAAGRAAWSACQSTSVPPFSRLKINSYTASLVGYAQPVRQSTYTTTVGSHSVTRTAHETIWKNGQPRTGTAATCDTQIESVVISARDGVRVVITGTNGTTTVSYPAGTVIVSALGHGAALTDTAWLVQRPHGFDRVSIVGTVQGVSVPQDHRLVAEFGAWEHARDAMGCDAETARKFARVTEKRQSARDERRVRLLARLSSRLTATLSDATACGYCLAGITAWATARGVDLSSAVPLSTLVRDADDRAVRVALLVARRAIVAVAA